MRIMQPQTRAKKTSLLCTHWMQYLFKSTNKVDALSDFKIWFTTTFAHSKLTDYEIPWIPFPLTRWLRQHLQPTMSVFEWGSGASTLFFAKRVNQVISIEYDLLWHQKVIQIINEKNLSNVDLHHVSPESLSHYLDRSATALKPFQSKSFPNQVFIQYASSILDYPNEYFDLILVDGRVRMACLEFAIQKVKNSGIIVLDNTERVEYRQYEKLFSSPDWLTHHFDGPVPANIWPAFGRTTIFSRQPLPNCI